MAETEEGGRGDESRGGEDSGSKYSETQANKTFKDLSNPAKGILEQKDKTNYPAQVRSVQPLNLKKYIIINGEQAITNDTNWNAVNGNNVIIKVTRPVIDDLSSVIDLTWDEVSHLEDLTGDNLAASATYGTQSTAANIWSDYKYILYLHSLLPWYPQYRIIRVTWNSGYTKVFNVLIPGRMSHAPVLGDYVQTYTNVRNCNSTWGPFMFLDWYHPKTNASGVWYKFSFWATIAGPSDTFFQGAWSINPNQQISQSPSAGGPHFGRDLTWFRHNITASQASNQGLINLGAPVPGIPGEQHVLGIVAANQDTYFVSQFTGGPSAYLLPPISTVAEPQKYYTAVNDAMSGEHLFGYNGMGNGAQWRSIQIYGYNMPECTPRITTDTLSVCTDPNTAAFYQYTGVECDNTTITLANLTNPALVDWIDGGCCPTCNLIISPTVVNPTTAGGTDGSVELSIIDNTGLVTGTANYTYVIAPINNENAGKGNGVNIGSGAVSDNTFTFGFQVALAQSGGALGNPTYAISSLLGYVPAVVGGGAGASTQGLEAGSYTVYVFDSTVNPGTTGGTPDPDGCLARTVITIIDPPAIAGCTDNDAGTNDGIGLNYNSLAVVDDNSCLYCRAADGLLVDYQSNPFNGTGEFINGQNISVDPALNAADTTLPVISLGSVLVNTAFQNFIYDIVDANGIQNADYKMQLYKLSSSTQTLTGAQTVGGEISNSISSGLGFHYIWNTANLTSGGTLSSMTYGHYGIKIWVDDPDSSSEIEQCFQILWVDVPVFVCEVDFLTSDGVYITDPALQSLTFTICNMLSRECCDDPVLTLIPDQNGTLCNAYFQLDVICNPSPQTLAFTVQQYNSNTGWIDIYVGVPFAQSPIQTLFIYVITNNQLNTWGAGDYRVLVTSTYASRPGEECVKGSNALEWTPPIFGCMDVNAFNYNSNATCPTTCMYCIYGCTDPTALNYDPNATCSNVPSTCTYPVYGCTDPTAINYNPLATIDDGSCIIEIPGCTDPLAINYNYDCNGNLVTAQIDDGCCMSCVGNEPILITSSVNATAGGSCIPCTTDGSITVTATTQTGVTWTVNYYTIGGMNQGNTLFYADPDIYGSGDSTTYSLFGCDNYFVEVTDANGCRTGVIVTVNSSGNTCGCTDPNASNYSSTATVDDGTCLYCGCTDSNAINYNPNATCDDGSCIYQIVPNPCIPTNIDELIKILKICISKHGHNFYNKYVTGQSDDCSIMNVWKLILINYLLTKKGLNCLYNCADISTPNVNDVTLTCGDIWVTGGPSTGLNDTAVSGTGVGTTSTASMFNTSGTLYMGDVIKHHISGDIWIFNGSAITALTGYSVIGFDPESGQGAQSNYWIKCNDTMRITNFTDSTNYLDIFSKFITKFCADCDIPTGNPMIGTTLYSSGVLGGNIISNIQINNQNLNI